MNSVRVNAFAKLNLTLDVVGKEGGYHLLDSLVTTVDLYDRIAVKKRKDDKLRVTMHGMGSEAISPENNNALKAAEAFRSRFQTMGADITIYKNIPFGAGMGGSSADISGTIRALSRLYGVGSEEELKALADGLGSDTGYLLRGGFARIRSRGEEVEPLSLPSALYFLVLVPKEGVGTSECFATYDALPPKCGRRTDRALSELMAGNTEWAAKLFGNDLYEAAIGLNQKTRECLLELRGFSPWGASMTGSGSAVFAVFETRELCEWAKSRYRGTARAYVLKSVDRKE